jgi:hypothetical protein
MSLVAPTSLLGEQSTSRIDSYSRILATVAGERLDRIPVFAPLSWHPLTPVPQPGDWKAEPNYTRLVKLAQQNCDAFAQLEIAERTPFRNAATGYGMLGIPEGIFDRRFLLVPTDCVEQVGHSLVEGRQCIRYCVHTPQGQLTTTEAVLPGEDTVWELEPLIKDTSDAEKLLSLPSRFDAPDLTRYWEQRAALGKRAMPVIFVTSPLTMVSRLTGFQRFLEWTISERPLVARLVAAAQERIAERLQYVLDQGVGPIIRFGGCEQATPPMMSGRMFDQFVLGYERPLWQMVKRAGGLVWVHCHGRVRTVLEKFADSGVDLTDPVEPPTQGDITLREARKLLGDRVTLIGNIEFSALQHCTPAEIESLVAQAVAEGGPTRLILAASAEVVGRVDDQLSDNIACFIESAVRYGQR